MKLHADNASALNTVTAYGPGYVEVNRQRHSGALLLFPEGPVRPWSVQSFEQLSAAHVDEWLGFKPELILLGTGPSQRFPHPRILAPLAAAGLGLDAMDTAAACRTYNILMSEGRKVLAALLPA